MNLQQFKYILALNELKHFESAANKCFISQSTLSTMIHKFEDEIGIKIFNRKTKPVSLTKEGEEIVKRIKVIDKEVDFLDNVIQELKGEMSGELRIGIIPTIAPYLLPVFLPKFAKEFPKIKMIVQEMTTAEIQKSLKLRSLDIGVLATPLEDEELNELSLYSEPFVLYDCSATKTTKPVVLNDIDFSRLWLMQDGHCLQTQVQQICDLSSKTNSKTLNFEFKAGSLDSLIRFTKSCKGLTILPYLSTLEMSDNEKGNLLRFSEPKPVRSVGLITHKHFVKRRLLKRLQSIIKELVTVYIPKTGKELILKPLAKV